MNARFEYNLVKKELVDVVYEINILRLKTNKDNIIFGKLTDLDGTVYESREILIHTPAEHTI